MDDNADRVALGARLKTAREYRNFSQEEVAKFLGISRSAVSLVESGARKLDVLELQRLAQLYSCPIEELTQDAPADQEFGSINLVARATSDLSPEDQDEVLRFAEYLRSRRKRKEE